MSVVLRRQTYDIDVINNTNNGHSNRLLASRPYRAPLPQNNYREWVNFFMYRCLVFPKKCPQRKACTSLSYSG